jgi:hypothetical protein
LIGKIQQLYWLRIWIWSTRLTSNKLFVDLGLNDLQRTGKENAMPQSSHNQAAELHNLETHVRRRNCHLTRRLFGSMLRRMEALLLLAG